MQSNQLKPNQTATMNRKVTAYVKPRHGNAYIPVNAPLRVTKTTAVATLPNGKTVTFNLHRGQLPQPTDRWATLSERGTDYGSTLHLNVAQTEANIKANAEREALEKRAATAKAVIDSFLRNHSGCYGICATEDVVAKIEAAALALSAE